MKSAIRNYWAVVIPIAVVIIALLFFLRAQKAQSEDNLLIGMVDATNIDIASSIPGRVDSLAVHAGDTVKKGQLLAILSSTEINALKAQAQAAIVAAQGQLELLQKGASPELIQAAGNLYQISQEHYTLFNTTYGRMQNLYNEEVISGQERDVFYFKKQAAEKEMETARLNLQLLQNGARPELIKSANAIVQQAEQAYEITKSLSENSKLYAPSDGIISSLVVHEGELASIGYPIMSVEKWQSKVIRFNVRQDQAGLLQLGKTIPVKVPGCDPEIFQAKVVSISPTLEFANWTPSKDRGKVELRTFTIELEPEEQSKVQGLRSGMTASLSL
ncbi:HlyD family secretion protein [Olivibacter sitiensis]|uniref:HlyD family secretion protein n=1 Tax=Olivibacter sitiensis TaxID=376470 RepID=UPI0003FC9A42|nr:efflux RND transporter periplasmic adaptor subunit [Olivibacter sitiensis]